MKESKAHIRNVFCLLLVALILFASYSSTEYVDNNTPKKEQKEKESNNGPEKKAEIREFSVEAILPIIHFQIPVLHASLIEFPQIEFLRPGIFYRNTPPISSRFKKLFTCIISVNAP